MNELIPSEKATDTFLKSISIGNYRCFDDLTIPLNPQLNVLVSANGKGKTTVLDAIRIALGPYFRPFAQGKAKGIEPDDVRKSWMKDKNMEYRYPASIAASGCIAGKELEWSRFLHTPKSHTTIKESRALIDWASELKGRLERGQEVTLPLFAAYSAGRLWQEKSLQFRTVKKILDRSRLAGYANANEAESCSLVFLTWFIQAFQTYWAEYSKEFSKLIGMDGHWAGDFQEMSDNLNDLNRFTYYREISAIRTALDICLEPTGWKHMDYSFFHEDVILHHEAIGQLGLFQMSDGIRIVALLVGDLAYRAVRLNPHLGSKMLTETPGIVMIDEIDLHLHPAWQQKIIPSLMQVFPNIQFIVTTHSPQVLSTVPSECIRIFEDQAVFSPDIPSQGSEASRILTGIFGVENRPQSEEIVQALNLYAGLVHQDRWNDPVALDLRVRLDAAFGNDDPELRRLDRFISNRKWELGK